MISNKDFKAELESLESAAQEARKKAHEFSSEADTLEQAVFEFQEAILKERGYKFKWADDGDSATVKGPNGFFEEAGRWAGWEFHLIHKALEHAGLIGV